MHPLRRIGGKGKRKGKFTMKAMLNERGKFCRAFQCFLSALAYYERQFGPELLRFRE
jgi:hypothetical protein